MPCESTTREQAVTKREKIGRPTPRHAPMQQFRVSGNDLLLNGKPIGLLRYQAGQTPFYAYDRSVLLAKIAGLREAMPDGLHLHYAVKANPMPALVDFVATRVDGLDVASGGELRLALNSGMPPEAISFAGPGKQVGELRMAIAAEATINVESPRELDRIHEQSAELGIRGRVAIRINPDFELKASGMKMGGGPQQFGIDVEQLPSVLRAVADYDLAFRGFHIYTGSQNLDAESVMAAQRGIFDLVARLIEHVPTEISLLNIGGGLGIPYFPGDLPIELAPIGEQLETLIDAFHVQQPGADIAMELGRYIVGDCGVYVCEVTDVKESRGTSFVIVDGGLNHHLAASGNFGQVIRRNYPVAIANKMSEPVGEPVQIVGPLCTPLDLLANQYALPTVEVGDLVVIYQSGAYGFSASPREFLGHPQPVELLV